MRSYTSGRSGRGGLGRTPDKATHFWTTVLRLFRYLRGDRFGVIFSIIVAAAAVILSVRAPKILGSATDVVFTGVKNSFRTGHLTIDYPKLMQILLVVAIIYLVAFVCSVIQQWIMTRIAQRTVYTLRKEFKLKLTKLPVSYYDEHNNGDLMSRMVNDMDNIAGSLSSALIQLITSILTFVGVIYFMITINLVLSLVAFVTVPLSLILVRTIAPLSQKLFRRQQAALGELNNQIEETFAGHTVVKTFNQEKRVIDSFEQQNEQFYHAAWRAQFISTIIFPSMRFLNNLDYLAMAVIGGIKVISGTTSLGDVQAMLQYSNQFAQPITQIANLINTIQATVASAERIFQVFDEAEMVDQTGAERVQDDAIISFENVAFNYVTDQPLLTDYSMQVKAGQVIAIVGPTGAGKSTIINLLERFYDPTGGVIRLKGEDIRNLSRHDLRDHFAMVLQETWLFAGTIMENIRYGNLAASDAEVIEAAKMAYADEFIMSLPDGYATVLNQEGSNISQGQRQLLTIARAFIANPEILILDEATSSVDTQTEHQIQAAMGRLLKGRTSFVVAHRLSTIRDADQILVMNHGSIVERGTHTDLLAANGAYADLYNSQWASI
ncbi:ABC-type multidrug transport system, ATPase and permease components [Weissella oryzae SG25]|uniref:ABC-type multidrug transport system, ATPase and permease components n=1 Tax=Weissella oryzae (strain DSM 25784 / JCM 18191 / LMG 30913 / SG25) TaxID=1329250 RepID=A0A069CSR7_WEIOS|nr:ABC transporter ATP-binding protein [Weissella oryzae]GAK30524.1 ABC-type multidrug transport system, ATPase and permease components [Weissella oryzae SG25]